MAIRCTASRTRWLRRNDTGAIARSYVDALVLGPDNQTGARSAGFYDDELVMTDDGWKIARRRFTMVLLQSVPEGRPLGVEL